MRVLKFGGSSVGSAKAIRQVGSILETYRPKFDKLVVIVSAFEKVTDTLIKLSRLAAAGDPGYRQIFAELSQRHHEAVKELIPPARRDETDRRVEGLLADLADILHGVYLVRDLSPRTSDFVMSFGERLSAPIVESSLRSAGLPSACVDARELVQTDQSFGSAKVNFVETNRRIQSFFQERSGLFIVTGFIGSSEAGETTTLGRGGSDYTAAIFGAALGAEEIEIWTDVDGVMTADPRKVKKAFSLPQLTYEEAMELSHFGAKVIYPPTIQPAMDRGIPVSIRNTFNPSFPGTIIRAERPDHGLPITGISSIGSIALLLVEGSGMVGVTGILKRLFDSLSREKVNVILVTQASSEHSICLAVEQASGERAKRAIEAEFEHEIRSHRIDMVGLSSEHSIVAVVGENMRNTPGIAGRTFQALGKNGINISAIAQGSSELNISAVIGRNDEAKALNALHDAFFLSGAKTANIFLAGAGLVGKTLLDQIESHLPKLLAEQRLELRLVGLANSKRMLLDIEGIPFAAARQRLEGGEPADLAGFVQKMKDLNLPNSVFVDCTASSAVPEHYEGILRSAISIVTPNKKANSGPVEQYRRLKAAAKKANVKFFYETNVGAGLPIINTIGDLRASGDEILRIEAVLSGTLSYIFNTFAAGRPFSEVVKEAKAKGYTEPDPRDDLSGQDVARKLLILAREMGYDLEESDVRVQGFLPQNCLAAPSIEDFFRELQKVDDEFESRRQRAEKDGQALRFIGRVENGAAMVSLQPVGHQHPFYSLSGSDNIISFVTKRYHERPLVVKGPGAGTDVTAAGVFADIVRVASYLG